MDKAGCFPRGGIAYSNGAALWAAHRTVEENGHIASGDNAFFRQLARSKTEADQLITSSAVVPPAGFWIPKMPQDYRAGRRRRHQICGAKATVVG